MLCATLGAEGRCYTEGEMETLTEAIEFLERAGYSAQARQIREKVYIDGIKADLAALLKKHNFGYIRVTVPELEISIEMSNDGAIVSRPWSPNQPSKQRATKGNASDAHPEIPTELLKEVTLALGHRWFGRKAALRSKRIVAEALRRLGETQK